MADGQDDVSGLVPLTYNDRRVRFNDPIYHRQLGWGKFVRWGAEYFHDKVCLYGKNISERGHAFVDVSQCYIDPNVRMGWFLVTSTVSYKHKPPSKMLSSAHEQNESPHEDDSHSSYRKKNSAASTQGDQEEASVPQLRLDMSKVANILPGFDVTRYKKLIKKNKYADAEKILHQWAQNNLGLEHTVDIHHQLTTKNENIKMVTLYYGSAVDALLAKRAGFDGVGKRDFYVTMLYADIPTISPNHLALNIIKGPCDLTYNVSYDDKSKLQQAAVTLLQLALFPNLEVLRCCDRLVFELLSRVCAVEIVQRTRPKGMMAYMDLLEAKNVRTWCFSNPLFVLHQGLSTKQRLNAARAEMNQRRAMKNGDPYVRDYTPTNTDAEEWDRFEQMCAEEARANPNYSTLWYLRKEPQYNAPGLSSDRSLATNTAMSASNISVSTANESFDSGSWLSNLVPSSNETRTVDQKQKDNMKNERGRTYKHSYEEKRRGRSFDESESELETSSEEETSEDDASYLPRGSMSPHMSKKRGYQQSRKQYRYSRRYYDDRW